MIYSPFLFWIIVRVLHNKTYNSQTNDVEELEDETIIATSLVDSPARGREALRCSRDKNHRLSH